MTDAPWRRWLAWLVVIGAAVFAAGAGCATNPVTGKRELALMSEAQELRLGLQSDAEVRQEMGLYDDPALQRYVQQIGARLAATSERPQLQWRFAVVDVAAPNAFALPGGYIYVTRGILPYLDSEAELAAVVGHEIGHVTARHAVRQYTRATAGQLAIAGVGLFSASARSFGRLAGTGLGLLFLKYGREDEVQADALGVRYASRAGWDPDAVPRLLTTLGRLDATSDRRGVPTWLETHPQPADRAEDARRVVREIEGAAPGRKWTVERAGFLRRLDGLVFGDDPREGFVRGSEFLHPEMRIAVVFPAEWPVNNGKTKVIAASREGAAFMLLQPLGALAGRSPRDVAASSMSRAGFSLDGGRDTTINGLPAFVGSYSGTLEEVGAVHAEAAHVACDGQFYLLAGIASASEAPTLRDIFSRAIRSFRELSLAEAAAVRPNRIALYTVSKGDTWESIARRTGVVMADALAVMNGFDTGESPREGQQIKIVITR